MKAKNGLPFRTFLKEELSDAGVRGHYEAARAETLTARAVIAARKRAGLTQAQLGKRVKTDQKAVWRLESGRHNATVAMLWRIAQATGSRLRISLVPRRSHR